MNDSSARTDPIESRFRAAVQDYLERIDRGEVPDLEEFIAEHPAIADELRSFIAAEAELRRTAGAERSPQRSVNSTQSFTLRGQETIGPQSANSVGGLTGQFGRYRIVRVLGHGAMGTVYLALDTQLKRQVALKTPHFAQQPKPASLERFYREARAAAMLRHPNICPVYDVGQIDGTHYISMAYIEGRSLSAFIPRGKPQPERQTIAVVRKLALALQEAHDHGIVHRDLKPANIMIDTRNEPIIMDFGLARHASRDESIRLTQSGMLIGTPAYMSPEQIDGEPEKIGAATDQYSLGVILYELLTGQLPFRGSITTLIAQIVTKGPRPPSQLRPDLDPRIEAACVKMLSRNPADRFASLSVAADELAAILRNPSGKPKAAEPGHQAVDAQRKTAVGEKSHQSRAAAPGVARPIAENSLTAKDLASPEELAGKRVMWHDYDRVIRIIEQVPEGQRNPLLEALLETSRVNADAVASLICEIEKAVRLNDRSAVLIKADQLLAIKPGHRRALEVQRQFGGYVDVDPAQIEPVWQQFTRRWKAGGWIPWSVLAFGAAVFAAITGLMLIHSNKTAVIIDVQAPGTFEVVVKGSEIMITGPKQEQVRVEPGDQELKITYAGLEAVTKSFHLKKGQTQRVTVSIVDSKIAANLEGEISAQISGAENEQSSPKAPEKESVPEKVNQKPLANAAPSQAKEGVAALAPAVPALQQHLDKPEIEVRTIEVPQVGRPAEPSVDRPPPQRLGGRSGL